MQEGAQQIENELNFREGSQADSRNVFNVFVEALRDLAERRGVTALTGGEELDDEALWQERSSLFRHLAESANTFWIAELNGEIAGYARSLRRGDLILLTEFFVTPRSHGEGIGRELLRRAFPGPGAYDRALLSTLEAAAMVSYLKAGLRGYFPVKYFSTSSPVAQDLTSNLRIEPFEPSAEALDMLDTVDEQVLGHTRRSDHKWLAMERQGCLYRRGGRPVGYGYVGAHSGPFAVLEDQDWPAVLAHAENAAAKRGHSLGLEIPLINRAAVDYVVERGYRMSEFTGILMADRLFGDFERYVVTDPAVML